MSIKQKVFKFLDNNPKMATINNVLRRFEDEATEAYLISLYWQHYKEKYEVTKNV